MFLTYSSEVTTRNTLRTRLTISAHVSIRSFFRKETPTACSRTVNRKADLTGGPKLQGWKLHALKTSSITRDTFQINTDVINKGSSECLSQLAQCPATPKQILIIKYNKDIQCMNG